MLVFWENYPILNALKCIITEISCQPRVGVEKLASLTHQIFQQRCYKF